MRLNINHKTSFTYDSPRSYGLLQLRKTPQSSSAQSIKSWSVNLEGARQQTSFLDQHGNRVDLIEVLPDTERIDVEVSGEVDTYSTDGILGRQFQAMPLWYYERQTPLTAPIDSLVELAASLNISRENSIGELHALSERIRNHVEHRTGETAVSTTAGDAWQRKAGVCQDHSHIFLSIVRHRGLPARYVSGYLLMDDRTDQDASHAWAEVFVEDLGWVGFDVSNGISPDQRYVRIAQGSDYSDAAPTRGMTLGAGQEKLVVSIQVQQ